MSNARVLGLLSIPLIWDELRMIEWTCNLLIITFLINLPSALRRKIGQKALGLSYEDLLGLGIIINVDFLKCDS